MARVVSGILIIGVFGATSFATWALMVGYSWSSVFASYVIGGQVSLIASIYGFLMGDAERRQDK